MLGFSSCSKIDDWEQDIVLNQYATNEQRLALSRKAGLCHYVGSRCTNRTFSGCTIRKGTRYCFKSKLARIICKQSRIQPHQGCLQYSLKSCPVHGPTPLRSSTTHLGLGRDQNLANRVGSQLTDGASSDCALSSKAAHVSLAPTEGL